MSMSIHPKGTRSEETLGQWLQARCQQEKLSLRQAAQKANLNHVTIADILNGHHASSETVRKLAAAFRDGDWHGKALEDYLLILAGHKTRHGGELSQPAARLMDSIQGFDEKQMKLMSRFADFLTHLENEE